MATIADYKKIVRIIDRTFAHHEQRLAELREETIRYLRGELTTAHIPTHSTPDPSRREPSEPL